MLALIDGDVLCHLACMDRWETKAVRPNDDGIKVGHVRLDEDGKKIPIEYTREEDTEFLKASYEVVKKDLDRILEATFSSDYKMAVKGEGNFRIDMFPEYKVHRSKNRQQRHNMAVPLLRQLLVHEGLAVAADGMEADDYLRIWATECIEREEEFIVCSIDKDLKCIPGLHYYMRKTERKIFEVSEEESVRFHYEQLLMGDPSDNIPGILGIGPVSAKKSLALLKSEEQFQEQVVAEYLGAYGDDWEEQLLFNGRLIYLKKTLDDEFSIEHWPIVQELKE